MADHVYHVTEVVGTSPEGLEPAISNAIARTAQTVKNLDWFELSEVRGHIEDGRVAHYQVSLKIGFRVEEPA